MLSLVYMFAPSLVLVFGSDVCCAKLVVQAKSHFFPITPIEIAPKYVAMVVKQFLYVHF